MTVDCHKGREVLSIIAMKGNISLIYALLIGAHTSTLLENICHSLAQDCYLTNGGDNPSLQNVAHACIYAIPYDPLSGVYRSNGWIVPSSRWKLEYQPSVSYAQDLHADIDENIPNAVLPQSWGRMGPTVNVSNNQLRDPPGSCAI
jgi:hypothetical protein